MRALRRSEGEGDGARQVLKAKRTGACGAADTERALQRGAGRKQGKGAAAAPHGGAGPIPGAGLTPGEERNKRAREKRGPPGQNERGVFPF